MDYRKKYLKYKQKYMMLKGGATPEQIERARIFGIDTKLIDIYEISNDQLTEIINSKPDNNATIEQIMYAIEIGIEVEPDMVIPEKMLNDMIHEKIQDDTLSKSIKQLHQHEKTIEHKKLANRFGFIYNPIDNDSIFNEKLYKSKLYQKYLEDLYKKPASPTRAAAQPAAPSQPPSRAAAQPAAPSQPPSRAAAQPAAPSQPPSRAAPSQPLSRAAAQPAKSVGKVPGVIGRVGNYNIFKSPGDGSCLYWSLTSARLGSLADKDSMLAIKRMIREEYARVLRDYPQIRRMRADELFMFANTLGYGRDYETIFALFIGLNDTTNMNLAVPPTNPESYLSSFDKMWGGEAEIRVYVELTQQPVLLISGKTIFLYRNRELSDLKKVNKYLNPSFGRLNEPRMLREIVTLNYDELSDEQKRNIIVVKTSGAHYDYLLSGDGQPFHIPAEYRFN
jgi:hypothetical protein